MEELVVGDELCSFETICDVLGTCSSADVLWTNLVEIARSLEFPNDRVVMIKQWLLSEIKTSKSVLYEILEAWRGKKASDAKLSKLVSILEVKGLQECACALRKQFGVSISIDCNSFLPLNYKVKFQGSLVPLCNILRGLSVENIRGLSEKFLNNLHQPDLLVNNSVPPPLKYYIPRRLTTRCHLDPVIFNKPYKDIFVLRDIQLHRLAAIAKDQGTDISSNQLVSLSVRFILLEYHQDFDKICKLSTEPVHLINHSDGQFIWEKSYGDISTLQSNLHGKQNELNEGDFKDFCLKTITPICISDTPGMGKTVLLASTAHKIMSTNPEKLVRFIVLREFVQKILSKTHATKKQFIINLIAEQTSESEFGREVIKLLLQSEKKLVHLLFDGYDEVLDYQIDTAKLVLKTISQMGSVRLYVSTRPHLRDELENILGVLGFNIQTFGADEQINFLFKYWEQQKGVTNHTNLLEFAILCLRKLKETMNDFERDISGIPLQCYLLAEVFKDEAIKYSSPENRTSDMDTGIVIHITSIFEMYEKLMESRYARLSIPTNISLWKRLKRWSPQYQEKFMTKAHMYAALQLIFPSQAKYFKTILANPNDVEIRELCAIGILEKKSTNEPTPRFVHRTFAEYFLGMFITRELTSTAEFWRQLIERRDDDAFLGFFFSTVMSTNQFPENLVSSSRFSVCMPIQSSGFLYPVVCYFINAHLNKCNLPTIRKKAWTLDSTQLYDVATACINHDYPALFKVASESQCHKDLLQKNFKRLSALVLLSAKHSSIELFKIIYQLAKQHPEYNAPFVLSISPEFKVTLLHVAVERGNFAITDFVLKSITKPEINELKYIVHCCVAGSIRDKKSVLSQKVQIIQLLSRTNPNWITETLPNGTSPILTPHLHVDIVKVLVSCGADLKAKTAEEESVLHICTKQGNHVALEYLLSLNQISVTEVSAQNKLGLTPFLLSLKFRKGLTLDLITMMENKGLVITSELASEGLKTLYNGHILDSELDDNFVQVMDHLIAKGGKVVCKTTKSPWELIDAHGYLQRIIQATKSNDLLVTQLTLRGIFKTDEMETYLEKSQKLYNKLSSLSECKSFEILCASLVACNQIEPFILIKDCLHTEMQEWAFRTPPTGIIDFINSKHDWVAVLRSLDVEISFVRLINTINSNVTILTQEDITAKTCLPKSTLNIFVCKTATRAIVGQLAALSTKIVILCNYTLYDIDASVVLNDEFGWNDLSIEFQTELKSKLLIGVNRHDDDVHNYSVNVDDDDENTTIKDTFRTYMLTDMLGDFSTLKNELLVSFIQGWTAVLTKFSVTENMRCSNYLNNNIFQHFFPDKLVFHGISYEELKVLAKYGQKVGQFGTDIQNVEYILIEDEKQFDQVCKNVDCTIHLIAYDEGTFKLVKTKGPESELKRFMERKVCESIASCDCDDFIDDITAHLLFEIQIHSEKFTFVCLTNIFNILPAWRDSFKIQQLFTIQQLFKQLLRNTATASTAVGGKILTVEDRYAKLMSPEDLATTIVNRWIQHFKLNNSEWNKLNQVAVNTIFPDSVTKSDIKGMERYIEVGLVKQIKQSGSVVFVHDTVAWYFITEMILETETLKFLIKLRRKVFHDCFEPFDFTISLDYGEWGIYESTTISSQRIRNEGLFRFIELLLSSNEHSANELKLSLQKSQDDLKIWIHACVHENRFQLLQILLSLDVHPSFFKSQELVILAIKFANLPIIQTIIEKFAQQTAKSVHDIRLKLKNMKKELSISILHIAVMRGNYSVIHYLLKNYLPKSLLSHPDRKDLLHLCVMNTHDMTPNKINARKQIIDLLIHINPVLAKVKDKYERTALLVPRIHVDLIFHLIKHGVNINEINKYNKTILHECPAYLSAKEYDQLLQHLCNNKVFSILSSVDDLNNVTPLQCAVEHLELLDSTLEIFSSAKVDFKSFDRYGNPVLFEAIESHRSVCLVKNLIRHGADVKQRGCNNRTVLHWAARYCNLPALKYFISLGCDVNTTDQDKNTPLHFALQYSDYKHLTSVVEELVKNKTNVNTRNNAEDTPLAIAIRRNSNGKKEHDLITYLKVAGAV